MDESVPFGSTEYLLWAVVLLFARGMDFLSTWIATPNLLLEANPLARRLGWKWGMLVNLAACLGLALLPLAAVVVATTSLLVAAHNFQSAWIMRTMGEESYRDWYLECARRTPLTVHLFCLLGQTGLAAIIGVALVMFGSDSIISLGAGFGLIIYGVTVLFYTLLSWWRLRRASR